MLYGGLGLVEPLIIPLKTHEILYEQKVSIRKDVNRLMSCEALKKVAIIHTASTSIEAFVWLV
jgi:hypothetical protein